MATHVLPSCRVGVIGLLPALMGCLVVHRLPPPLLCGASLVGNPGYAPPGSVLAVAPGFGLRATGCDPAQAIRPTPPEVARLLAAGLVPVVLLIGQQYRRG